MNNIFQFAKELAFDAGKILLKGFRSEDTEISYKSRTDLVTNIDRESEEFIFNTIRSKYPEHSIIAEDGSRKDSAGEFLWYVDPLDATNNYAHGLPFFCVSIGIFSKDLRRITAGVVYDPYHGEMFAALYKKGSYLNERKISVSEIDDLGVSLLATGFPYEKNDTKKNNLKEFNRFLPEVQGIRRLGSAALDLAYTACGRIDGFWEPLLKPWDMAGGSIIVEEAGGIVTNYIGDPFDPEFPEIVASNARFHGDIIKILSKK